MAHTPRTAPSRLPSDLHRVRQVEREVGAERGSVAIPHLVEARRTFGGKEAEQADLRITGAGELRRTVGVGLDPEADDGAGRAQLAVAEHEARARGVERAPLEVEARRERGHARAL